MSQSTLDLPQIWQRPSAEDLLASLRSLEVKPPIWNPRRRREEGLENQGARVNERRETAIYLSSIIKSSLSWIHDDDEKDLIWSEASRRISERSGRAAMGEIVRRWPFEYDSMEPFELVIREPAITGDSIGFKTWGSSYLLALQLQRLASTSLFFLFDESLGEPRPRVLELGSGTGLLGLAAAAIWKVHVVLSDLPEIVPNLAANSESNGKLLESLGGSTDVGTLTWGGSSDEINQELFGAPNRFKIILAADPLYDDDHPTLLSTAIFQQLSYGGDARAVVMVPQRDKTTARLLADFKALMAQGDSPLICLEEGELEELDDWECEDDEVKCWWGIFGRRV